MNRLTTKEKDTYSINATKLNEFYTKKGQEKYVNDLTFDAIQKLGKLEDLMENYEIESVEALEEIIKDYDDMAKCIVEMGLGVKVYLKENNKWIV